MTLTARQAEYELEAKAELIDLFTQEGHCPSPSLGLPNTVFAIIRHASRSGGTKIVDFLVFAGQPLYITARVATAVRRRLRGFPVVGGQERTKTGMVLHKTSPEELIRELSLELFGDLRLILVVL